MTTVSVIGLSGSVLLLGLLAYKIHLYQRSKR